MGGATEEEYWAGWQKFLTLKSAQERHHFYSTKSEHDKRFEIFKTNMDKITEHNKGHHSWKMGITQFSDMTPEEFKSYVSCGSLNHKPSKTVFDAPKDKNKTVASSIDWVPKGAVTPVKNQGQCGSCWAFSTTGAIEGRSFISSGKLISLSEQDLVDCSTQNSGCNGGLMDYGFAFVESNQGLCTETDYPYLAYQEWRCREDGFQQYESGVLTGYCGTGLDHGVLLVGYGTDGTDDYWKVKNSWGADWGESGYIRLCRNCDANKGKGQCGILLSASYPIV